METYSYKVRDRYGKLVTGKKAGNNTAEIGQDLSSKGFFVISIKKDKEESAILKLFRNRVKKDDIFNFLRQLSILVKGGIPLVSALQTIEEQLKQGYFKKIVYNIKESIRSGSSFSDGLRAYPDVFKPSYINMIEASEVSGQFDRVLDKLSVLIEKQQKVSSQVKGALTYPISVMLVAITVVTFILVSILPQFTVIFLSNEDLVLPASTVILLALSDFLQTRGFFLLIGIVGFVLLFKYLNKFEKIQEKFHFLLLKFPVFGNMYFMGMLANFASTIAFMYQSGVPLVRALKISQKVVSNRIFINVLDKAIINIERGTDLAVAFDEGGFFPALFVKMVEVGEKTGKLDVLLLQVSNHFDDELDLKVKSLSSVIEPVMILGVGAMVGFIVLSTLLPMFQMVQSFR